MKCSICGTDQQPAPSGRVLRCLNCGTALTTSQPPPSYPSHSPTTKHTYTTPYGRLLAQVQKSGAWAAVTYLTSAAGNQPLAAKLLGNLSASWRGLNQPGLPKLQALDEKELRCTWLLPPLPRLVPLSSVRLPLPPSEVKSVVTMLASQLELLHQGGLAAFDLAPAVIFAAPTSGQLAFVPTLWLASQAHWAPGKVQEMPFVAPELDQAQHAYPEPARADVYALGALTWFLLTGTERKKMPTALPSERSPGLAGWDAFIDGCCRTAPGRRFESVAAAVQSLAAPTAGSNLRPAKAVPPAMPAAPVAVLAPEAVVANGQPRRLSSPAPRGRRRLRWAGVILAGAAVLLLAIYLRWDQFAPWSSGPHGFGDTVLQYDDRSYEGSSWKKLKEVASLSEVAGDEDELYGVTGWDDDNFWITRRDGRVFQYRNGHWTHRGKPLYAPLDLSKNTPDDHADSGAHRDG